MAVSSRQLNPELHQWLDARQKSLTIVKTTKTPSGQFLDWVPVKSQMPGGKIAAPPPARFLPDRTEDKQHPVKAVVSSSMTRRSNAAPRERFPSCARISRD